METQKIPMGYKQTEIGAIPEGWVIKKLVELARVETGSTPPTKEKSNYGEEYCFVGPADLGKSVFISDTEKKLSKKGFSLSRRFPKNSILFTCIGSTIGKMGIASKELTSNQQINAIFPSESFSQVYIYYILSYLSPRIKSLAGEQAVPQINKTQFQNTQIPIPPTKTEQTAIATAISDIDALVEKLDKFIAKKRTIKQGTMQELLTGKRRLSGFSEKWEAKKLGEVCNIKTGKKDVNQGNPDGVYPFFTCSRESTFSDQYSFDGEAILIAGNGEVGNLHYFVGKFEAYQRTYILQDFTVGTKFLWYQMESFFKKSLGIGTIGSSIPYIKRENIADFIFSTPKEESEQVAIAQVLSDMDEEIAKLEQKLTKYRILKQGMMQVLLTGKVRLI